MPHRENRRRAGAARGPIALALAFALTLSLLMSCAIRPSAYALTDENGRQVFCGKVAHRHSNACYSDGKLVCGLSEHTHTLECYSDRSAVENDAVWRYSVSKAMITGRWNEDLVAVAKTQIGYGESSRNYIVRNGVVHGYTRYGDWIDNSESVVYGPWCASFVAFCMYYAGIRGVPFSANCATWVKKLIDADSGLYYEYGEIEPDLGDLVFFYSGKEEDAAAHKAYHMGIFVEANETGFITIEGNVGPVSYREYKNDAPVHILGYCRIPKNPGYRTVEGSRGIMSFSAEMPEDAEVRIRALSDEECSRYELPEGRIYFAFEASLLSGGEAYKQRGCVTIEIRAPGVPENLQVFHFKENAKGGIAEKYPVEKLVVSGDTLSFIDFSLAKYIAVAGPDGDGAEQS